MYFRKVNKINGSACFVLIFVSIVAIGCVFLSFNQSSVIGDSEIKNGDNSKISGLDTIREENLYKRAEEEDKIPGYDILIILFTSSFVLVMVYWFFKRENSIRTLVS